jgi:hypothetical protein
VGPKYPSHGRNALVGHQTEGVQSSSTVSNRLREDKYSPVNLMFLKLRDLDSKLADSRLGIVRVRNSDLESDNIGIIKGVHDRFGKSGLRSETKVAE